MNRPLGKRGTVALYLTFIVSAITIIVITAVVAPLGTLFNSKLYVAGEGILLQANESMSQIQDPTVRQAVQNATASALSAGEENIVVTTDLFQYAWIIVIVLVGLITFLFSRRLVEYGYGGGFI